MDRALIVSTAALALNFALGPRVLIAQRRGVPAPPASSPRTQKQQRAPDERQNETDQLRAIAAELRAINDREARREAQRAADETHKPDQVFWPPLWSNWALVGVGALAAGAAIKTLRAIEREVIETGTAAAAAKQSADIAREALYVGERAYVHLSHYPGQSFAQQQAGMILQTKLKVENTGRTPARLSDIRLAAFVTDGDVPDQPPSGVRGLQGPASPGTRHQWSQRLPALLRTGADQERPRSGASPAPDVGRRAVA